MKRLLVFILLFTALLSLSTYHWLYSDVHQEYPEDEEVVLNSSRYIGQKVSLFGVVDGQSRILVSHGEREELFEVVPLNAQKGGRVEVLGVLEDKDTVVAQKTIVYEKWTYYSIFIRSVVAIPILLFMLFRYWRFSVRELMFRRE